MPKLIYLASPFFNEFELECVKRAEKILSDRGFELFSPRLHEVRENKDENLSVGQKLLGRNLIASLQLMLLAPPVIKDKKKIILFDGKAAVIVMRDFDW